MNSKNGTLFSEKTTNDDVASFSLLNSMIILNHKYELMQSNLGRSDCYGVINLIATRYSILSFIDWCSSLYDFLLLIDSYFKNMIQISPTIHSISPFYAEGELKDKNKLLENKNKKTNLLNRDPVFTKADRLRVIRNRHMHGLKNIRDYMLSFAAIDYLNKENLFNTTYKDFIEIYTATQINSLTYLKNKYGDNLMLPKSLSDIFLTHAENKVNG